MISGVDERHFFRRVAAKHVPPPIQSCRAFALGPARQTARRLSALAFVIDP